MPQDTAVAFQCDSPNAVYSHAICAAISSTRRRRPRLRPPSPTSALALPPYVGLLTLYVGALGWPTFGSGHQTVSVAKAGAHLRVRA